MGPDIEKLIAHETLYLGSMGECDKTGCASFLYQPDLPEIWDVNHALRLRDDGRGPDAVVAEVIRYYRARGLPPVADVDSVAEEQGIGQALRKRGLTPLIGDWLLMRYFLKTPPAPPDIDIQIELLPDFNNAAEITEWVDTASSDEEPVFLAKWREYLNYDASRSSSRLYLARIDGQAVAACSLFSADGWGRVENVITRPEYRRRGAASVLVTRAIADSIQMGNELVYLFTDNGGIGEILYNKLGFLRWEVNFMRRHKR